jgi:hypothetical protein
MKQNLNGAHFEGNKTIELKKKLIEGEKSKMVDDFDAAKHLSELHKKYL